MTNPDNAPTPLPDILDVREAAVYLRINEQTVRRLARERQLPAFKVGGGWRFKRSTLDGWAERQQSAGLSRRVLVIDDEANIRDLVRLTLTESGFTVDTAASGPEGLSLMQQYTMDLVFLDLRMPEMDGVEVLKEIRTRHGSLPVVILTAFPDSDFMTRALEYSPITLLSKPFTLDQLTRCAYNHIPQA